MNQADARNFIMALNSIAPYVPPMLMNAVMGNPICRIIEQAANHDASTAQMGEQQGEPPKKPHLVEAGGGG